MTASNAANPPMTAISDSDNKDSTGEGFVFICRNGGLVFKTIYSAEEIEHYLAEYNAVAAVPARDHPAGRAGGFR